jgi:uncharacterized damage-inducible protein DinB
MNGWCGFTFNCKPGEAMNKNDLTLLYEYNRWANARVLDAVSKLKTEQFTKNMGNSFASVRDTLTHIMSAEWIWLRRWKGTSPKAMLDPADYPSLDVLQTKWAEIEREQADFVSGLPETSLETVIAYVNTKGETWRYPLGQMMQHVVNHSSYHRGQITTMLRQLGAEAVSTDFLLFFDKPSTPPK